MFTGFKNRAVDPTLDNHLIEWWTNNPFIHVELFFEEYNNIGISARTRDDGVTPRPFMEIVTNTSLWEFYQTPVESEKAVLAFMLTQMSAEFNYGGIFVGTFLKRPSFRQNYWFCSELCYSALQQYAQFPLPYRSPAGVTPADLRLMIQQANCERMVL